MHRGALVAVIIVAVVIVLAAAWLGVGYALTRGTGPVVSEEREIPTFTQVDVSGEGTLIIGQGDTPALRVEAQRNVLDRLETSVSGDTLRIRHRWDWFGFGVWGHEPITYYLTVPDLTAIELSGSVAVEGQAPFNAEEFVIDCSGSTEVNLEVKAASLRVHASGSSDLTLTGSVDSLFFDTSGSTTILARNLASRIATIDCSGSSDIEVNASEELTVDASGSSNISYVGDPALSTDISGSGEVRRLEP